MFEYYITILTQEGISYEQCEVTLPLLIALLLVCATPLAGEPEPDDFTLWKGVVSHIAETEVSLHKLLRIA